MGGGSGLGYARLTAVEVPHACPNANFMAKIFHSTLSVAHAKYTVCEHVKLHRK